MMIWDALVYLGLTGLLRCTTFNVKEGDELATLSRSSVTSFYPTFPYEFMDGEDVFSVEVSVEIL